MARLTQKTQLEKGIFRHFTFRIIRNKTQVVSEHTLNLNPEDYTQSEPARTTVTKTLGGAHIDEWGRDLITFNLKGTTGYGKRTTPTGDETDGWQAFKALRNDIFRYFLEPDGKKKQLQKGTYELHFLNWEDGEYYSIMPQKFDLLRSKSRPMLYAYDFSFVAIEPLGAASVKLPDNILENLTDFRKLSALTGKELAETVDTLNELLRGLMQ